MIDENSSRSLKQKELFENGIRLGLKIYYKIITGFGKTRLAILFIKELFLRYKVLSLENIFEKFEKNDFQIQYNSSLIDKNLIIFILNKFIVDTNIKNYLIKTSIYQIPGYKIIKLINIIY